MPSRNLPLILRHEAPAEGQRVATIPERGAAIATPGARGERRSRPGFSEPMLPAAGRAMVTNVWRKTGLLPLRRGRPDDTPPITGDPQRRLDPAEVGLVVFEIVSRRKSGQD